MKTAIFSLIQASGLDMKSISRRLKILEARHVEISAVYSNNPQVGASSRLWRLLSDLALEFSGPNPDVGCLNNRSNVPCYANDFPGEHYRALPALVREALNNPRKSES